MTTSKLVPVTQSATLTTTVCGIIQYSIVSDCPDVTIDQLTGLITLNP